jgi:glycosyltransferase involved in cell wall biosynthesis
MPVSRLKRAARKQKGKKRLTAEIFFSYIIPTIGRSSLAIAVNSVLSQDFSQADFEIIIVNDSGVQLQQADWHDSPRVRIINTNKCERSLARNSGAAVARGRYLGFLDDDDWLLPGALDAFWNLANHDPNAAWLYGGIQIVDEQNQVLAEINSKLSGNCFAPILGGAWAPIQASLIKSQAFFEIGGFNPLICGTEDEDLCRRTAYCRGFANTANVVACLFRGQTWNTSTNYLRAPDDTKYSRDLILSKPRVFQRLRASAHSSYARGRVLRVYMSTVAWNLKKKRFFTSLSRLLYCLAFFALSIKDLFSRDFWAGLTADHVPESLHFVMKNYDRKTHFRELDLNSNG